MTGAHSLRIRILLGPNTAMGPGKAELLEAVQRSGSISAAARSLGMSYRRAWLLVDTMNQCFREPLVEKAVGGEGGGGARVTALGVDVLRRYREMELKAARAIAGELAAFEGVLVAALPPSA